MQYGAAHLLSNLVIDSKLQNQRNLRPRHHLCSKEIFIIFIKSKHSFYEEDHDSVNISDNIINHRSHPYDIDIHPCQEHS